MQLKNVHCEEPDAFHERLYLEPEGGIRVVRKYLPIIYNQNIALPLSSESIFGIIDRFEKVLV